jgi:hypothetical protein
LIFLLKILIINFIKLIINLCFNITVAGADQKLEKEEWNHTRVVVKRVYNKGGEV